MNYILNDTIKDCKTKYFHSFDYRCVYDIKFLNMESNEEVFFKVIIEYMKYEYQFYGLVSKIKNALKNGFRFNELVKLTEEIDSCLFYLKLPIPIMYREFFLKYYLNIQNISKVFAFIEITFFILDVVDG